MIRNREALLQSRIHNRGSRNRTIQYLREGIRSLANVERIVPKLLSALENVTAEKLLSSTTGYSQTLRAFGFRAVIKLTIKLFSRKEALKFNG
jgi:hypothetical protein